MKSLDEATHIQFHTLVFNLLPRLYLRDLSIFIGVYKLWFIVVLGPSYFFIYFWRYDHV